MIKYVRRNSTKKRKKVAPSDIIELCKQHLPINAVPQSVDIVKDLPKSPVGKVLKHKLREEYVK